MAGFREVIGMILVINTIFSILCKRRLSQERSALLREGARRERWSSASFAKCQRSIKTSDFKESKTAPWDLEQTGSKGHLECPQSERLDWARRRPANNDLLYSLADRGRSQRRIASELGINRETVRRYLILAKPAISITGKQAWDTQSKPPISIAGIVAGRPSRCERVS